MSCCQDHQLLCTGHALLLLRRARLQMDPREMCSGLTWMDTRARRFGFETGSTMTDGLWQGPTAVTQDFLTVAYRMQLLGINTIRLPMSFQARSTCPPCCCC